MWKKEFFGALTGCKKLQIQKMKSSLESRNGLKYKNKLEAMIRNTLANKHLFKIQKPLTRCKGTL